MRPAVINGHAAHIQPSVAAIIDQHAQRNISELVRRMRIASSMWAIAEAHIENNRFTEAKAVIAEAKQYLTPN